MTDKPEAGFDMVWINGNKYLVGQQLADDLKAERDRAGKTNGAAWQEEHTARIQAETRLEMAEARLADLRAQLEDERRNE